MTSCKGLIFSSSTVPTSIQLLSGIIYLNTATPRSLHAYACNSVGASRSCPLVSQENRAFCSPKIPEMNRWMSPLYFLIRSSLLGSRPISLHVLQSCEPRCTTQEGRSSIQADSHRRKPPMNAWSLPPSRTHFGNFVSFFALPPPSTT